MAPPKKSRSPNKRPLHTNDPSAEENYRNLQRSKKRKKKLSDKLGPQWSKGEIENFYDAYRKHGQDWKKVASLIYDRSIEMVETLYNMNRAYLSLPEGTASVVGLTALMEDYYNVMEGNDSERENYDASGFRELPNTNKGKKVQMSVSNEDYLTTHSVAASGGCLSSLRSLYYGYQPRVAGKRTPRVPISYSNEREEWENHTSGNKSWQKSEFDGSSNEVAHHAALALAEASQRRASPSTSGPWKMKKNMKSSNKVSGGRKGRPNEEYGYDLSSLVGTERVRTIKTHHKMKKRLSVPEGKIDSEISNAQYELLFPLLQRDKSRKLSHGESSVQIVEETESFNLEDKSCIPEAKLSVQSGDKGKKIMVNAMSNIETTGHGKSKPGRSLSIDVASKKKKRLEHTDTTRRRKHRVVILDTKIPLDVHLREDLMTATSEHIKPTNNENQVTLPVKQGIRSRRKMELRKLLAHQKAKSCDDKMERELMKYSSSVEDRTFFLKDKFCNCVSSTMVRRWCIFEWFYSAIDYPWFARREFVEYLDHVGLENIPRLTHHEWGVIKSSLGKPRRFSECFLHGERMKLQHYRESVRQYYAELRAGTRQGLPADLAKPLSVGQRIIALHPNTLEVHNGSVLSANHDTCWIRFDNQEVGIKLVMDFDCMPFNPMDNFPEALRHQSCSMNSPSCKEPEGNSHPNLIRELEKASTPHTINALQHDTFSGNSLPLWLKPPANTEALSSTPCSLQSGCGVVDIVKGSREKARLMVNVAIEVLLSTNEEGDDPLTIICGALRSFKLFEYQRRLSKSQEYMNDSSYHFNQSCSSKHRSTSDPSRPELRHSDKDYGGIPSNLITSCIATLLMIQACIERSYPPGNVAQILAQAVQSLRPRCSQNLHIYKEIETCMARIFTQLLSLVLT